MPTTCIEAQKGQRCCVCDREFKKGELILDHPDGLMCSESCGLTRGERLKLISGGMRAGKNTFLETQQKLEGQRRKAIETGKPVVTAGQKQKRGKPTGIVMDDSDQLKDVMSDKLRRDINKLGRRA